MDDAAAGTSATRCKRRGEQRNVEHGIVARVHEVLKEAKSYTRADYEEMERLRQSFYVFDSFGVLRQVARFVRSETGMKEVDFYDQITRAAVR